MSERQLFDTGPVDETTLTDRQQVALAELRRHTDGIQAADVGRTIHQTLGIHRGSDCRWCHKDGWRTLRQLQDAGFARRTRRGLWMPADSSAAGGYDPATAEIPF